MTHLNASAERDSVVRSGNYMNPDGLMASPRDNSDRRSTGMREVNGAWLGPVGEDPRPRKLPARVRPASAGMTRAARFAAPWIGSRHLWIGILIGTAVAGLVLAIS